jgi:hypothetical protein
LAAVIDPFCGKISWIVSPGGGVHVELGTGNGVGVPPDVTADWP